MGNKPEFMVWWIPQIPMKPFEYMVPTIEAGAMLLDALGKYDLFQLEKNIKPDYANVGGLSYKHEETDGEWWDVALDDDDELAHIKGLCAV